MNVLIIYAHPEPRSFDGEMMSRAVTVLTREGHAVQISDLYAMRFKSIVDLGDFTDPLDEQFFNLQKEQLHAAKRGTFTPDIIAEQKKVLWADVIIFQFPLWWYSVPAILKGWFDRVFAYGFAYGGGRSLSGRKAMLVMTTGGPTRVFTPQLRQTISDMLAHIQRDTLHFCGLDVLPPFAVYGAANASANQREQYLLQYARLLASLDRLATIKFD